MNVHKFYYTRPNLVRYFMINLALIICLAFVCPSDVFSQDLTAKTNISNDILTAEERAWISEHPTLRATNEMDWPPLDFFRGGEPAGFSIDYLNLVASKVGLKINYINGYSWDQLLELLKGREIDIAQSVVKVTDREAYLNFSKPYLELTTAYFGKAGSKPIKEYKDLLGKRIAVISGWYSQSIYKNTYPELNYIEYSTIKEALIDLTTGKVDLVSDALSTTNYIIAQNFITGLEILGEEILPEISQTGRFHLAARNDWPLLISILNKAMDAVSEEEFMAISKKWLSDYKFSNEIGLTADERQWLSENKVIKVGADPTVAPIEFINNEGEIDGISGDFLKLIAAKLNIKFEWAQNKTWDQAVVKLKAGEASILSGVFATDEKAKYLDFTESYLSVSTVIFSREGGTVYGNMAGLAGSRIAQIKNTAILEYIRRDYPKIEIIEVDTLVECLRLVASGQADAYVGDIPITAHNIAAEGLNQIIVTGDTPYIGDFAMGIRSDLPLLSSAMKKALHSIPTEKRAEISRKWMALRIENRPDYTLAWQMAFGASFIIGVILIWVFSLKKEVKRRVLLEKELVRSQKEAEEANAAKSNFLANMSHEIRTPLNAIIGFSEVMSSGLFGKIKQAKYIEYLDDIKDSGEHLATVINDILDLSKIEAGKWQLTESEFNLDQCIENAFKMIIRQAEGKNIKLIKNITTTKQAIEIIGDVTAYKRIIINLLSNSVKFTQQDGKISCEVSINTDGSIKLEIIDNGIGIPADEIDHVLKPFAQAHDSRNMNDMGTGLGLPIVNQLCELHDGSFSLQSEVNVGTIATVLIPSFRVNVDQGSIS